MRRQGTKNPEPGARNRLPILDDVSYGRGGIAGGKFLFVNDTENPSYIENSGTAQTAGNASESEIEELSPVAWYRYGVGITVTGQGVSTWADQSGNGFDLLQGTDGFRPALQSDGSILCNGTDEFMATAGFTLAQPTTIYGLFKTITSTSGDHIYDGATLDSAAHRNGSAATTLNITAGTNLPNTGWVGTGVYGITSVVFNGSSSLLQVNKGTPASGNAGAGNANGFTLASQGGGGTPANIQAKEFILFSAAHGAATRPKVINYLDDTNPFIVLASTASSTDDAYNGMSIQITGGTGAGQDHQSITDYDGASKTAYVSGEWTTVPDATSTYRIVNRAA